MLCLAVGCWPRGFQGEDRQALAALILCVSQSSTGALRTKMLNKLAALVALGKRLGMFDERPRYSLGWADRGALRPYIEFIPDALHREYESWRLRVRLYLAPQASDEHIDAAIIGFRATPGNGVTELLTRQCPARTV